MYLMYVDESGDTGMKAGSTPLFCLSGVVLHESNWHQFREDILILKRWLRTQYGLPLRSEIHASEFMQSPVFGLPKHQRLAVLRSALDMLASLDYISVTNIVVDKSGKSADYDILINAWTALIQRFENTLLNANYPGGHSNSTGMIISDAVSGMRLIRLMRKMMVHNPITNTGGGGYRDMPLVRLIEDPSGRDSRESPMVQMADVCAYFLNQHVRPNSYMRKQSGKNYIKRLGSALNTRASRSNALGIVKL